LLPKSNAEDTEYVRCGLARLDASAPFAFERGSSASSDSLRDDAAPDRDEEIDDRPTDSDEARDASSSESRGGWPACLSVEKPIRDMVSNDKGSKLRPPSRQQRGGRSVFKKEN
jgi:hypothetical protein